MSKNYSWLLLSILAILANLSIIGDSILAYPETNVGLTRFEAIPLDNEVRLEWDTETELEAAGFMLKRGQNGSFDYLADPDGSGNLFILSKGGPAFGYNYEYTDDTAVNGEVYTYQLIEVEVNGSEVMHAESTVTVGIVPTNTPIKLVAGGGAGTADIPANVTETATSQATGFPSSTPETIVSTVSTTVPSVTPIPTSVSSPAARTIVAAEEVSPNEHDERQTDPQQSAVNVESEPDNQVDTGIAVAFAQEDPENYPAEEIIEDTPVEPIEDARAAPHDELQGSTETGANPATPEVIGATQYPVDATPFNSDMVLQDTNTANSSSSLAGKVYLWIAFIAALVIFTAAILGAILLYTRQRSKE